MDGELPRCYRNIRAQDMGVGQMTGVLRNYGRLRGSQKDADELFGYDADHFVKVRSLALPIAQDIENLGAFLQPYTAIICPECASVCCINRHSYHAFDDIVYIRAIGGEIPLHDPAIGDSEPCQFLSKLGCTLARSLRPYRCNWYFCSPLLAHITANNSNRHYRMFITLLQEITEKRQKMMEEYALGTKNIAT